MTPVFSYDVFTISSVITGIKLQTFINRNLTVYSWKKWINKTSAHQHWSYLLILIYSQWFFDSLLLVQILIGRSLLSWTYWLVWYGWYEKIMSKWLYTKSQESRKRIIQQQFCQVRRTTWSMYIENSNSLIVSECSIHRSIKWTHYFSWTLI